MFGFSLASQIFQGSTERTWNCVARLANLFWNKFNHLRHPIMPRSRKRHHSHSRSRSRSHSPDRSHERQRKLDSHEKDGKRRKVESYESPLHKRSVSCDRLLSEKEEIPSVPTSAEENSDPQTLPKSKTDEICVKEESVEIKPTIQTENKPVKSTDEEIDPAMMAESTTASENKEESTKNEEAVYSEETKTTKTKNEDTREETDTFSEGTKTTTPTKNQEKSPNKEKDESKISYEDGDVSVSLLDDSKMEADDSDTDKDKSLSIDSDSMKNTPRKPLTPRQIQKRLESEQRRKERIKEREEQRKKREEEKERSKQEKLKQKQEKEAERLKKEAEKQKEKEVKEEQKRKEKEEKEQKRREKEEQKRKEREQEKLKKQQEIEEKNKEKQKEEEKKQKAAAAFVNFFVAKKPDSAQEDKKNDVAQSNFMPFEIKSDMRMPPQRRDFLTEAEKKYLEESIESPVSTASYLQDLKSGKTVGKCFKTWPYEETDDVTIVEEVNPGETICEDASKTKKLRVKFLMFHENRRPPYFGTWRKKTNFITPRKPLGIDSDLFNYEEDSDDDWEEEEQGESLNGSDEEADKENDDEKDDYEVDNEFFVPHGHLSDDEIDDEENARLSPESLKQKLKLLHDEFEEDMKSKTHKLKPRSIGCIWYDKDGGNVDESIHRYLEPFAMITNGQIIIKKRSDIFSSNSSTKKNKVFQELPADQLPMFLKIIHGNVNNQKTLVKQFTDEMSTNGHVVNVPRSGLIRNLKQVATWKRCQENGPLKNKFAWFINDDVKEKYNLDLVIPNSADN